MLFVTGTYCDLLTCICIVVSLVDGVKGTKNALSLEVLLRLVTSTNVVVVVCGGWGGGGKGNLKLLRLSFKVPPPIR